MIMPKSAMETPEVIIIGGGPAGASTALSLLERGIVPLILERDSFPRFHIGESLTGECGGCLRQLGMEEEMLEKKYPIKHGVNVYGTGGKNNFWVEVKKRCPETQVQIPNWTWQVVRSSFDKSLLARAVDLGARQEQWEALTPVMSEGRVTGLVVKDSDGKEMTLSCKVIVDCSGQATFLSSRGIASKRIKGDYDSQIAIFSQLKDLVRDQGEMASEKPGNTMIFYREKFHWSWFIPLTDDVTSIGVVTPASYFKEQNLSKEDFLRAELTRLNPELTKRITNTDFLEEVRAISSYSYNIKDYTGPGYLCVGDSHRFTDPIFSFGVFFSMKEGQFAGKAIQDYLSGKTANEANPFQEYQEVTTQGQDVVQDLIDCFWEFPLPFQRMAFSTMKEEITDLFAGRIYGEMAEKNVARQNMRRLLNLKRNPAAKESEAVLA